jgi:hypothetical protein
MKRNMDTHTAGLTKVYSLWWYEITRTAKTTNLACRNDEGMVQKLQMSVDM